MPSNTSRDATPEHLDVLVIGAGLSGIGAGHYLQSKCPWADYAIFEARDAIGGTWDLFRYPGVRSDSDMHTLGYSFRPWDGEKSIADGDSILQYIKDTAAQYGIDRRIRFHHRVTAADWSSDDMRWHVTAERSDTGESLHVTAVAPLPITTTRRPETSRPSGQACGCTIVPTKSSRPAKSGR